MHFYFFSLLFWLLLLASCMLVSSPFRSSVPRSRIISRLPPVYPFQMSSSRHSPSHRYHRQQQFRASSRSPSHSSYSHPVFESPLALSPNPAAAASSSTSARGTPSLVDPNSTAGTLTGGGDFLDPTQVPRGSVRSARSFSSPSSSIGLTAGSSASQFHSPAVYPGLGSGLPSSHSRQRLSTGDPRYVDIVYSLDPRAIPN